MDKPPALTPALSRAREREHKPAAAGGQEAKPEEGSLSRLRERARVRARGLRQQQTQAESLLWYHLRNRQFLGLKFRRQQPIGPFFADFACKEIGLVLELDGGQHADAAAAAYDARRTVFMKEHGFQTLRFWDHDVMQNTNGVLEAIRQFAAAASPHPSPLPHAGEGETPGSLP